ncbi:MAG TPA: Tol-Pal system beta propeller repeat protein TolB [Acetobacteraceae bacterium]|nr:Tol-Pal system beta propeller repeat protein TolB [Acetobacteraceae bacterium]
MRNLLVGRRGLLAGSASLLIAPQAVLAQQAPAPAAGGSAGDQSAVIDVNRAQVEPIPIAIPTFGGQPDSLASQIVGVISNDLAGCGLFRPLDPASFVQASSSIGQVPKWQDWKVIGARALVTGQVDSPSAGQVRVEFRLWDVLPEQQLQGTAYTTADSNWRRVGHMIADVIYERLLGEKGYFDTRIAYISDTGPRSARIRRLAVMDQDGANNRFLTSGEWMALDPRFHPIKVNELAFMSFAENQPRVYLFDLGSGRQSLLGAFSSMTFAPRFSPDGSKVILSEARGAGSDIVVVDLGSMAPTQLTNSGAIDTSPCYSPDGSQICFNSDRDGSPQIYIMGADGSNPKRISYGDGRYFAPVWSPRGDLIAFIRQGDSFALGVMNTDGTGERILSEGFNVDGPSFCPNGRVIAFWRSTAATSSSGAGYTTRLVNIDITGFNERMIQTPTDASDPAWSPLLS